MSKKKFILPVHPVNNWYFVLYYKPVAKINWPTRTRQNHYLTKYQRKETAFRLVCEVPPTTIEAHLNVYFGVALLALMVENPPLGGFGWQKCTLKSERISVLDTLHRVLQQSPHPFSVVIEWNYDSVTFKICILYTYFE